MKLDLIVHIQIQLPDEFNDFVMEHTGGDKLPSDQLFTHCHRELFHAQWKDLLDDEFLHAYEHGMVLMCGDGIERRLFPRIFTYSADYPEKYVLFSSSFHCTLGWAHGGQ